MRWQSPEEHSPPFSTGPGKCLWPPIPVNRQLRTGQQNSQRSYRGRSFDLNGIRGTRRSPRIFCPCHSLHIGPKQVLVRALRHVVMRKLFQVAPEEQSVMAGLECPPELLIPGKSGLLFLSFCKCHGAQSTGRAEGGCHLGLEESTSGYKSRKFTEPIPQLGKGLVPWRLK